MAERILCVLGKLKAGGVESIMYSYYRFMDKSKYQYDFVYEESSDFQVPKDIIDLGAKAFVVPDVSSPFKYVKAIENIIKREKYDIVHVNMNTLSVFSLFAAKICKVKYRILHNHSTSSGVEKKRDLIKKVLRPFNRIFTNKPAACSELAARWMYGDEAFEKGRIKVFRNGVDTEKFSFSQEYRVEIRREFNLENKKVIGHVGRFMTQKNHLFLIDIFAEYAKLDSNGVLVLVGIGELFNKVADYVKAKGLEDRVIFTGARSDVYKIYSAFDVFVLPSLYEGLPLVGVEACASGLPVLFSDFVTRESKVTDAVEFLPIDDPVVWAEKLSSIGDYDRYAIAAQMKDGPYNILNCTKELEKYYDSCH